jgi:hypothetical protein
MWLENVRSAWVPTQSLLLLASISSFCLAICGMPILISLATVTGISHIVVYIESWQYIAEPEVRMDRKVIWNTFGFQMIWIFGVSCCWLVGWSAAAIRSSLLY